MVLICICIQLQSILLWFGSRFVSQDWGKCCDTTDYRCVLWKQFSCIIATYVPFNLERVNTWKFEWVYQQHRRTSSSNIRQNSFKDWCLIGGKHDFRLRLGPCFFMGNLRDLRYAGMPKSLEADWIIQLYKLTARTPFRCLESWWISRKHHRFLFVPCFQVCQGQLLCLTSRRRPQFFFGSNFWKKQSILMCWIWYTFAGICQKMKVPPHGSVKENSYISWNGKRVWSQALKMTRAETIHAEMLWIPPDLSCWFFYPNWSRHHLAM